MTALELSDEAALDLVYVNMAFYAFCHWLQENSLPFLVTKFGGDPAVFGHLRAAHAALQLVSSPLAGRLGDVVGARRIVLLSHVSVCASYLLVGTASSLPLLFASRLPLVFKHGFQGGQMLVTDMSPRRQRLAALGRLSMSYSVGMVLGNVTGGAVMRLLGEQTAALLAAAGAALNSALAVLIPPTRRDRNRRFACGSDAAAGDLLPVLRDVVDVSRLGRLLQRPRTRQLVALRSTVGLPVGVLLSTFPMMAVAVFGLEPLGLGGMMAYLAVTSLVAQGLVVPCLCACVSERAILCCSLFTLVFAFLLLVSTTQLHQLYLAMLPLQTSVSVLSVVLSSLLTKSVPAGETGAVLGISASVGGVIDVLSPVIGSAVLGAGDFTSVGWLGAVVSFAVWAYVCRCC